MSAESKDQRKAAAIAEHHPEKLYAPNRGLLKMSKEELHKYASTKEKGLPKKKRKKKRLVARGRKHKSRGGLHSLKRPSGYRA